MIIENTEALRTWLISCLVDAYDWNADPMALAKYVIALVKKKDRQEAELKSACLDQLEVFFHEKTAHFVDTLLSVIHSKDYLKPYVSKSTTANSHTSSDDTGVTSSTAVANEKEGVISATINEKSSRVASTNDKASKVVTSSSVDKAPKDLEERRKRSRSRSPVGGRVRGNRSPPGGGHRRGWSPDRRRRRRSPERGIRRRIGGRSRSRSRSGSPRRRPDSISPGRRPLSPSGRPFVSRSPRRFSRSPRRYSRSPPRRSSRSPRRSSRSPRRGSRSPPRRHASRSRSPVAPSSPSLRSKPNRDSKDEVGENGVGKGNNRCRDYDEKGFCMLGDRCPFDHGTDPLVVEDVSMLNFGLPPTAAGAPLPPGVGQPPVLPPPAEPYNPEAPGILSRPPPPTSIAPPGAPPTGLPPCGIPPPAGGVAPSTLPPAFFRHVPPPRLTIPPPNIVASQPPPARELVSVPLINTQQPPPSTRLPSVVRSVVAPPPSSQQLLASVPPPQTSIPPPVVSNSQIAAMAPPPSQVSHQQQLPLPSAPMPYHHRGGYRGYRGGRMGYAQTPYDRAHQERCELVVRKIPRHQNNIAVLNAYFSKFGNVINLQVNFEGDPESALIRFSSHAEANAAHRCTDAVLNNRFIRVFWHKPEVVAQQQQLQNPQSLVGLSYAGTASSGDAAAKSSSNGGIATNGLLSHRSNSNNASHSMDDLDETEGSTNNQDSDDAPPPGTEDVTLPSKRSNIKSRLGPKVDFSENGSNSTVHLEMEGDELQALNNLYSKDPLEQQSQLEQPPPIVAPQPHIVNYNTDSLRKISAPVMFKTKQEQEAEMMKKQLAMQKESAALMEKYTTQFKALTEKLTASKTQKEKSAIMATIKKLSGLMDTLRSSIAVANVHLAPAVGTAVFAKPMPISKPSADGANDLFSSPDKNASTAAATPTTPTSPTVSAAQALATGLTKVGSLVKALPTPPVANKEEAEKELLDAEMDLYNQLHQGGDTTLLKKRVENLRRQARALGLLDASGQWRGVSRGRGILARPAPSFRGRASFLGSRGAFLGGRGRGAFMLGAATNVSSVDRRPRSILLKELIVASSTPDSAADEVKDSSSTENKPEEDESASNNNNSTVVSEEVREKTKADIVAHFAQFGDDVEEAEFVADDPSAILVTFKSRRGAETAIAQGAKFRGVPLKWSWFRKEERRLSGGDTSGSVTGSLPAVTKMVDGGTSVDSAKSDGQFNDPSGNNVPSVVDEDVASSAGAPEDVDDILLGDDEEDEEEGRSWRH